jgi:trimeric autotransporter adhesin
MGRALSCLIILISIPLAACHASYPVGPTDPAPAPVAFQVQYKTPLGFVSVGTSFSFGAYVLRSDGAYEDVTLRTTWSSTDPSVIRSTTGVGVFVASALGPADVVAQYERFTTTLSLFVTRTDRPVYPFVTVSAGAPRNIGDSFPATLTLRPSATSIQNVTDLAAWQSSDPSVLTVSPRGVVTAVGTGTAQITASYEGLSAWYAWSVPPPTRPR